MHVRLTGIQLDPKGRVHPQEELGQTGTTSSRDLYSSRQRSALAVTPCIRKTSCVDRKPCRGTERGEFCFVVPVRYLVYFCSTTPSPAPAPALFGGQKHPAANSSP